MIERHTVNETDIWIKIDPHPVERGNPKMIPNEFFTASYFKKDPADAMAIGELMKDDKGQVAMFESPVAALAYAVKSLEKYTR